MIATLTGSASGPGIPTAGLRPGRSRRTALLAALTPLALLAGFGDAARAAVSNPPGGTRSILVFPQRDFVSASGYGDTDQVVVKVIHSAALGGATWSTDPAAPIAPVGGVVEVNHPGGACWFGTTPDIRPGDVVEIDIVGGPNAGQADATTVANVTAQRPVQLTGTSVVVHGTAVANDGVSQIPVAQLEQRLVAPRDQFDKNGRRTLRATSAAGADGTLSYDSPTSTNWTATYVGLTSADVTRALGAESRGMWLGAAVAPALEGTIFEIGAAVVPGPSAPCTAPLEVLPPPPGSELVPPSTPTGLSATVNNANTVTLRWTPSTDNVGVTSYGVYRDGIAVTNVQNLNGLAPAPTQYIDRNVPPGTFTYTVDAADAVGNRSAQSAGATATATAQVATLPAGIVVNAPPVAPVQIIGFPSRDFISSSGFDETDTVDVQVIRNGVIVSTSSGQIPQADPRAAPGDPFAGTVEVNHPGGGCWEGVTPELRAGDVIRTIAFNPASRTNANPTGIRAVDQTTVANVTAQRPVQTAVDTVQIHGTAMDANGRPIPLDQLDQRLVASRDLFDFNHRRTLRGGPGADGVTVYDTVGNPTGIKWTTTYSGLDAADVTRALGAESRMLWLGSVPLALTELTIFENSDVTIPGPAAGVCAAPLEAADVTPPSTPADLAATATGNQVTLTWTASADDWYVAGYRVFRDGQPLANVGGSVVTYVDAVVPPGPHTYTVAAFDTASPRGLGLSIIDQLFAGFGQPYGNLSAESLPVSVGQADVTAPTVPANLVATTGADSATLTWSASTDDVGVAAYTIYRDGVEIGSVDGSTLTYTDPGLAVGSYTYTVDAVDGATPTPNRSAQSAPATANVTGVADAASPSVPTGVAATTSPDIHGRDVAVSWTAATDDVGVTGYGVYRNGLLVASVNGTTLSFTDANLATGTYDYTVDAVDSAGNRSAVSAPPATAVVANDPPLAPHSLIAFPARDFISATGYTPGATYHFTLIRGGTVVNSGSQAADATGLIEVNHPGGTCWNVNTPDMRPGDVVRITDDATGIADQTTVANVTAGRPIATSATTVVIHGTAQDALGNPLPIGQIEQRLVHRDLFDKNGRRTLRAGAAGDGTIAYDTANNPNGTKWTATYTGLSAADVLRAVGGTNSSGTVIPPAESRVLWLGRVPLALTESTIFENGPGVVGGPSAPCTAPAETPVAGASFTPATVSFPNTQATPTGLTSAASTVTFSNGGGAPMVISDVYIAGLNPGDFARSGGTCPTSFPATLAAGASCTVLVTFTPSAIGLRQGNLSFSDNAANTTDQTVPLTGTGTGAASPVITLTPASLAFGTVNGGASPSLPLTVANTGGGPLTISALAISGAAAADFTVTSQTCTAAAVPAGGNCTITVQFRPGARAARAATLTLTHNATATSTTSTAVALTGTGGTGSVLSFSPNPVKFGTVTRGTTKDQTISVKNSGNAAATLSLASFGVTGAGYSVRSTTCGTLAANASCNVVVRFTAPNVVGTFNGTLNVTAANGLPVTAQVALTTTTK